MYARSTRHQRQLCGTFLEATITMLMMSPFSLVCHSRRLFRIMDPALDGKYSIKAAQRAAALALNCLHKNPKHRVSMSQVVEALTPLLDMTGESRGCTWALPPV